MSSFGGYARFRSGYWLGIRGWLLRERRDVPKRLRVIDAELKRIGDVVVTYDGEVDEITGARVANEQRIGFWVTPGSSLEKLIQAYIVTGGNPFDISMFLKPSTTQVIEVNEDGEPTRWELFPGGGVGAPANRDGPLATDNTWSDKTTWGADPGGYLNLKKYQPARIGGRKPYGSPETLNAARMRKIRGWANQEIAEKLHRLEWQIIKLCDLREQLEQERDHTLAEAWGGVFTEFDDLWEGETTEDVGAGAAFVRTHRVQELMDTLDQIFFYRDPDTGFIDFTEASPAIDNTSWAYEDDADGTEAILELML